ncbi:MAG: lamin tail domain-containing protein [bacterium]
MKTRETPKEKPHTRGTYRYFLAFCMGLFLAYFPVSGLSQVVINELMYHPEDGWHTNASGVWVNFTNGTEYVEIYNAGTNAVDLSTYRLDNGITYNFPFGTSIGASSFLVICQNLPAFSSVYSGAGNLLGNYSGTLKNGGERVTLSRLVSNSWITVDTISYIGGAFGTDLSDGSGCSLELVNPGFADLPDQFYGAWAASVNAGTMSNGIRYGGTPGRTNSAYNVNAMPVVGDVRHNPPLPPAGSSVLIECKAAGRAAGAMDKVNLLWRWDRDPQTNSFAELQMYDDGMNGDAIAGDGVYSLMFPPNGRPDLIATNGQLLEFRICAADPSGVGVTNPVVSVATTVGVPYSYFCFFGEDTGYTGEYVTYHIIMQQTKWTALLAQRGQGPAAADAYPFLDCSFVSSDGKVFQNCGVRQRGSTRADPCSYHVKLPVGEVCEGYQDFALNYEGPFSLYLTAKIGQLSGIPTPDARLCRVWGNNSERSAINGQQHMYCRMETVGETMSRMYPADQDYNAYKADGDGYRTGDLRYSANLADYWTVGGPAYACSTGNPSTAWIDLQNLTWTINQPASNLMTVITNRVDIREWASLFALNAALNNAENGILDPTACTGDELRLVNLPSGRFIMLQWDSSNMFGFGEGGGVEIGSPAVALWNWAGPVAIRNFLFNRPMVSMYVGKVQDILCNVTTTNTINTLFVDMGSMAAGTKANYVSAINSLGTSAASQIKTNLTVSISSTVAAGSLATVVGSTSVSLWGNFPQNYTDSLRVNGSNATWVAWSVSDMANTYGMWTNVALILTSSVNDVLIETFDYYGNRLISKPMTIIVNVNATPQSGVISSDTTWSNLVVVTGDVTVNSGARLTVASNAVVLFQGANRKVSITSGTLDIEGTENNLVRMFPSDGSTAWSIEASGSSLVTGSYAELAGGRIVITGGSTLSLQDSTVRGNSDASGIVSATGGGGVYLSRCIVSDYAKTYFNNTPTIIDECLLKKMTDAGVDFTLTTTTSTVSRSTISNVTGTAAADGVRFANTSVGLVTNCFLRGLAGNGVKVGASATGIIVEQSLILACSTGLAVTSTSPVTNFNNTIALCAVGLSGSSATTWNTIAWSNTIATNAGMTVSYSDVELPYYGICSGTANMNREPWFMDLAEQDCRLLGISPCLANGIGGTGMGATFPVGSTPMWPSNLALATLIVPTNGVNLSWQDNSLDEKWFRIERSMDGIAWIVITNVAANTNGFDDVSVIPNEHYYYRVRAGHARGESLPSEERSITTAYGTMSQYLTNYLRITEIMYNPTGGDTNEFLEFKNISAGTTLNLGGLWFTNGLTYSFPSTNLMPGAFYVIVNDPTGFTNRYPERSYQGVYGGKLSDGGEQLRIKDAMSDTIVNVTYKDAWYRTTDGGGYSLVPVETNPAAGDPDNMDYWRPSTYTNGSPGQDDPPSTNGIVINEVLSHSHGEAPDVGDWIELYNSTPYSINIKNWFISNSETNLTRFRITNDVVIPPHGYTTFTEKYDFGTNVPGRLATGFAFSEAGDSAYLSSGDVDTNLTSYRVSENFGGAERGVTFGRYITSDANVDFPSMSSRTPNASNAYPKVGPVVISEIMYNPVASGKEFIELHNISNGPAALYDDAYGNPTNTWIIEGGMTYTFPTGITLAVDEYILVVGVEPGVFRQATGLTNVAIRIFGPAIGQLGNAGDTVDLKKPTAQDQYSQVPYARADRVQYGDKSPWPVLADNGGVSLERHDCSKYGNDPANWIAASLGGSPGAVNNTNVIPTVAFTVSHGEGYETNGIVEVGVSLYPANTGIVTVAYGLAGGTASPGLDFSLSPGSIVFWPYDTMKQISLRIMNDATQEANETVLISLTNITSNARLGGNTLFTWTIIDTNQAVLAVPVITPAGTNFTNAISITITSTVPNSTIFYTTDGSIPNSSDNVYTGAVVLTSSARITARAYLGSYQASSWSTALFLEQTPPWETDPSIISIQVSQTSDDGTQLAAPNALMNLAGLSIPLGRRLNGDALWSAVRFAGINVGMGLTVTNAYIQFSVYEATNTGTSAIIFGHYTNSAASFETGLTNISLRPRTTNSVPWTISSGSTWTPVNSAGVNQRTPSLANIMNEISRSGWTSGSAMVFIFSNNMGGLRRAYSYDGSTNYAPVLRYWTATQEVQQYWLEVLTNGAGMGTITGGNRWVLPGSNVTVAASVNSHYQFAGWTGTVSGISSTSAPSINVPMTNARTLWGNFSDILYTNGVTEAWLAQYYPATNNFTNAAVSDTDGDGYKSWQEFLAGTVPTNTLSTPYWLYIYTNGPGTIAGGNTWYKPGLTATVDAVAMAHYRFSCWTGTVAGISTSSASLGVPMTNDRSLWGNFTDILHTNGVTEMWLLYYYPGTNNFTNAATSDTDGDGHQAWQEFIAGTDPTNALSVFRVLEMMRAGGGNTISWPAITGKVYSIYRSTNLLSTWPGLSLTNNMSSPTNGTVSFSDAESNSPAFYHINVQ